MRKLLCTITLLIAAECFVSAQTRAPLDRRLGNLVDGEGIVLTDAEVLDLIGEQVYYETYLGAKKQCETGRTLKWIGVAGTAVGQSAMAIGSFSAVLRIFSIFIPKSYNNPQHPDIPTSENNAQHAEDRFQLAEILIDGGAIVSCLGVVCFSTGVTFSLIGKNRLEWIADDYNSNRNLTWSVGATPNGVGVVLKF